MLTIGGSVGCGRSPQTNARLVGHVAFRQASERSYFFTSGARSFLLVDTPQTHPIRWQGRMGRRVLPLEASKEVAGLRQLAFTLPVSEPGVLEYGTQRFAIDWVPTSTSWPSIEAVATSSAPQDVLRRIIRRADHPLEELAARHAMARMARRAGDLEGYENQLLDRARRSLEMGFVDVAVESFSAAGFGAFRSRSLVRADAYVSAAEALANAIDDAHSRAKVALMRGYLDVELARYQRGLERLRAGMDAALQSDDAVLYDYMEKALSQRLSMLGRHDEALAILDKVAPRFEQAPPQFRLHYVIDRGWLRARAMADGAIAEDWTSVIADLERARTLATEVGDVDMADDQLVNLLYASWLAGRPDVARTYLEAFRARPQRETAHGRRLAALVAARLLIDEDSTAALSAFDDLIRAAKAEAAGLPSEYVLQAHHGRALAFGRSSAFDEAHDALLDAFNELEAVSWQVDVRQDRAPFVDHRSTIVEDAVRLSILAGRPADAFLFTERARRLFFRALELRELIENASVVAAERLRFLQLDFEARRRVLEGRTLLRREVVKSRLDDFDAQTAALEVEVRTAWTALFDQIGGIGMTKRNSRPLASIDPIADVLRSDDAIVSFVTTDGVRSALVVHRGRVDAVALAEDDRPIELPSTVGHVYLIPSAEVPLPTLIASWVPTLLETRTVSFLPFASILLSAPSAAEGAAFVVGDPEYDLPAAHREAEWVADHLETKAVLGQEATRRAFMARVSEAKVFHFAGHGQVRDRSQDPWRSGLRLARGEEVRLDELFALLVAPRVAVLSGCETGRAVASGRSTRIGLPEAFLMAGTRTVLATTRPIDDDRETLRFIQAFYRERGASEPVAAYRRAVLDAIKKNKKDWDAFFIEGHRE